MELTETDIRSALVTAYWMALSSPDRSSQNGAILFDEQWSARAMASNRFPSGVIETDERWERPTKYQFVEHAERGVIYQAARMGTSAAGLTMACAWAACADCARAIVESGVAVLVRHNPDHAPDHESWLASIEVGDTIMREGGVRVIDYKDPLPDAIPVLRNGRVWQP